MRAELEALVYELKHLRREGCETVYLADDTLARLRNAVATHRQTHPAPARSTLGDGGLGNSTTPAASPDELAAVLQEATGTPVVPKKSRTKPSASERSNIPPPPQVILPDGDAPARWKALREQVLGDTVCQGQVKPGKQVVFGVGSVGADIFFCGEAPGAEEETQGEPFVGPAGQLLTRIIEAMGLSRERVYIANIMNWRPAMPTAFGNRPPTADEMAYCLPYLRAQVAVVQPKVIVALGKTAVDGLLGPDPARRMGRIRGEWHTFADIPLIPTFHPSYLLRNNNNRTKRQVWEDMLKVMEHLKMPISEKQRGFFKG